MPRAAAAIGRSWRVARLSLPLPLPSLPPRFVGAFPYPLPHVDRHLSGSAALVRLSRRPKPFLHPLPPHVGVGFRHTQIAGWVRASSRRRFCPVTHASIGAQFGEQLPREPAIVRYLSVWTAEVPAHAQRMSSLLALDRELAPCRVARRACGAERGEAREGGRRRATAAHAACRGEGSTADWEQGTGRSARRTWPPCL